MKGTPMRILVLTNDDGIDAPGLAALRVAAQGWGDLRVIAPAREWSGGSHTLTTHGPIAIDRRPDGSIAVGGTPADCVRLALHHLATGLSWVLSGINAGGNLGTDLYHSGTVAAAREAAFHGLPSVAISHYKARGRVIDWDLAASRAAAVLADLLARPWVPGTFWNVNLPHPAPGAPEPEMVHCPIDPSPLPLSYRVTGDAAIYDGNYQGRARRPGADVDHCFGGRIAISRVAVGPSWVAPIDSDAGLAGGPAPGA